MSDDLNDSLDDLLGGPVVTDGRVRPTPPASYTPPTFTEQCSACRGTGRFVSWSGRVVGECFKCKGAGKKTFKSSTADRAKAREGSAARSARKAEQERIERDAAVEAWKVEHPAAYAWLLAKVDRSSFATSLFNSLRQWGSLTPGQLSAVEKIVAEDAAKAVEAAARKASAPVVEVAAIEAAFDKARDDAARDREGVRWLKLRLDTFTFTDAPASGKFEAAILVREGDAKLGRIVDGRLIRNFACTDAQADRIVAAAADPAAAAIAYGQRTGSCAVCGITLTNKVSRARGIGPICAAKYGF